MSEMELDAEAFAVLVASPPTTAFKNMMANGMSLRRKVPVRLTEAALSVADALHGRVARTPLPEPIPEPHPAMRQYLHGNVLRGNHIDDILERVELDTFAEYSTYE